MLAQLRLALTKVALPENDRTRGWESTSMATVYEVRLY